MPAATYTVPSFLGGEISQFAQGRFDKPDYKISLNVCLNAFPVEIGPWTRRPGTQYAGWARGGTAGRVIKFDFEQASPVTLEFTTGFLRFRDGTALITTNDAQTVSSISTANPAVVLTAGSYGWPTNATVIFSNPSTPLLENRQFVLTQVDSTHFSIVDALNGQTIDGSTLGSLAAGTKVYRVQELATVYVGTTWSSIRAVQAETTDILLQGTQPPQALTVTTLPSTGVNPIFAFNAAIFNDGPYLDPPTNGAELTPNAVSGIVTLNIAFQAFSLTQAYAAGAFVLSNSVNYESLQDQNVGNTPVITGVTSSTTASGNNTLHFSATPAHIVAGMVVSDSTAPSVIPGGTTVLSTTGTNVVMSGNATGSGVGSGDTIVFTSPFWTPVSAGVAVNNGQGFLGTDVGRLIRLLSEPAQWAAGTTYSSGNVVAYNPSGIPGESTYWQALGSTTGNPPGSDLTHWELITTQAAAVWTWGKIVALSNAIAGSTGTAFGNMGQGGGQSAAFDGVFVKGFAASAALPTNGTTVAYGTPLSFSTYVGKHYSGGAQFIEHVTVYPSDDYGFGLGTYFWHTTFVPSGSLTPTTVYQQQNFVPTFTLNLRAKNTLPASSSDGTLLGTSGLISSTGAPITIFSSDQTDAWNYVWVELVCNFTPFPTAFNTGAPTSTDSWTFTAAIAQEVMFNPPGTGSSTGINVEILGPSLLYTNPILTWRLGVYSNTTGFPTCGCYADGRLWLGGAVANRFDASVSNGINGSTVNFAPTDQYGVVAANNAISEVLNSDSINPIYWMESDQQGVIMGTLAGEWLIFAPTQGSIAPDNIDARPIGKHGCANIEPRRTEHTLVAVQRYARKLLELFPDVFSGKFTAPNIVDKAQHIVRNFIAELAYVSAATPIIWARDQLGNLFGLTYKRDTLTTSQGPTFNAPHRHQLGSGRTVQSICAGPSTDGTLDTLTMTTVDPASGIYHVEVLTDSMDEQTPLADAWFLDDAVNPSSTSTTSTASTNAPYGGLTINGLWHLNGQTVQVFAGGLDCGDQGLVTYPAYNSATTYAAGALVSVTTGLVNTTNYLSLQGSNTGNAPASSPTFWRAVTFLDFIVTNGSIFVPYGDGISAGPGRGLFTAAFAAGLPSSQIVVGFTYTSQGQLVRPIMPADTGARNGPALAKMRRTHRSGALLSNTLGISFGTSFTASGLLAARFTLADRQTNIAPLTTFSGVFEAPIFDQYSYDSMISWQVSRPWPATVVAIAGNLQTQDQ